MSTIMSQEDQDMLMPISRHVRLEQIKMDVENVPKLGREIDIYLEDFPFTREWLNRKDRKQYMDCTIYGIKVNWID